MTNRVSDSGDVTTTGGTVRGTTTVGGAGVGTTTTPTTPTGATADLGGPQGMDPVEDGENPLTGEPDNYPQGEAPRINPRSDNAE